MKLSNKKTYNVSQALYSIYPEKIQPTVWHDDDNIAELVYDDVNNSNNATATESELDISGNAIELSLARDAKLNEIKNLRDSAFDAPTLHEGSHYSIKHLNRLEGRISFMNNDANKGPIDKKQFFTIEGDEDKFLGRSELLLMSQHVEARQTAIALSALQMKKDIEVLTNAKDIENYTVEF